MPDSEQSSSEIPLDNDARLLLATFAGLVLATGSALIWRAQSTTTSRTPTAQSTSDSGRVSLFSAALSGFQLLDTSPAEQRVMEDQPQSPEGQGDLNGDGGAESRDAKTARSKERRRRGKDPLKEIFKGGKKSKILLKAIKSTSENGDGDTTTGPHAFEPHEGSVGTSSRSSSLASLKSREIGKDVAVQERPTHGPSEPRRNDNSTTYSTSSMQHTINVSSSEPIFHITHDDIQPQMQSPLVVSQSEYSHLHDAAYLDRLDTPRITLSSDSTAFSESTSDSHYESTAASSASEKPNDLSHLVSSQSMPQPPPQPLPYATDHGSVHTPSSSVNGRRTTTPNLDGSWDGHSPVTSNEATTYRKPPRFRSKSKATSVSVPPIPTSVSYSVPPFTTYSPSDSPPLLPSSPPSSSQLSALASNPELPLTSFTFPTLNPPSPTSSPGPSSNAHLAVNGIHQTTRHTRPSSRAASRRTPTPSHTPDPQSSVSTQTQIASLKGALEAARMREEKSRQDAERYAKECDILKWKWGEDVMAWRRREAELHTQIQQMVHQIQTYAAVFVSMSPSSHFQLPNQSQTWSYPSQHMSPSPSPQPPPQPARPAAPCVASPQMLSPTSPSLPFAMYPVPAPHQNLFSLLFPGSGSPNRAPTSSANSVSECSSVGSLSPVLNNSPSFRRGRRRNRTRTMTSANGGISGAGAGAAAADDWIITGGEGSIDEDQHDGEGEQENEGEPEFSDILADAILKRPDSIRVRSPTSGGPQSQQQRDTVFKFASISESLVSATEDEALKPGEDENERSSMNGAGGMADGASRANGIFDGTGTVTAETSSPKPFSMQNAE